MGKFGGALRGAAHLVVHFARLAGLGQFEVEHFDIAENDGEQVVEVVRDAAGEPTDGLHLGGLTQFVVGGDLAADVLHVDHEAGAAGMDMHNQPGLGAQPFHLEFGCMVAGQSAAAFGVEGGAFELGEHVPD